MVKADVRKDAVMIYHQASQQPKALMSGYGFTMDSVYWAGGIVGNYSAAYERYRKEFPKGLVVLGDNNFRRYAWKNVKGIDPFPPESDDYDQEGQGRAWIDLETTTNLPMINLIRRLEARIRELESAKKLQERV